jgi:hypothetical protein
VAAGHEGGFLLVTHLDELDRVGMAAEGGKDPVYAVAGVAERRV